MKLKLDSSGNVVLENGKPVYERDDGTTIAFDAPAAMAKITELNTEAAGHRRRAKEVQDQLAAFEGIDATAAREALKTVQNLSDKKLVDAGEVEKLKVTMAESFKTAENGLKQQLAAADKKIHKLTIGAAFSASEYIRKQTVLPPDIAERTFGQFFELEDVQGVPTPVGKLNGVPIMSPSRPGEIASFDEAITAILATRPDKNALLRGSGNNGSGGQGNNGQGDDGNNPWKTGNLTEQAKLMRENPAQAKHLATAAGKTIPGL